VHGPRGGALRGRNSARRERAQMAKRGIFHKGRSDLEEVLRIGTEQPQLVDRLVRVRVAQVVRPIRCEHE